MSESCGGDTALCWRARADLPRTDPRRKPKEYRPLSMDECLRELAEMVAVPCIAEWHTP
jgi:hypothetical protein